MTPEDERVVLSLVTVPGRGQAGSPEEVLRHFGTADGHQLGLDLLRDAVDRQDGLDVELALIVCATFGFTPDHLDLLLGLASADWHCKHEDVVSALGELRTQAAVDALFQATQWVPEYLDYDDSRALATKAIWALGGTPGPEAQRALERLLGSDSEIVRETAAQQLQRRNAA
jgi:HEAT repeat protein